MGFERDENLCCVWAGENGMNEIEGKRGRKEDLKEKKIECKFTTMTFVRNMDMMDNEVFLL